MNAGEIWVSEYQGGIDAVLLTSIAKEPFPRPDLVAWNCQHLIKVAENEYRVNKGRVSSRVDPSAHYTGEGTIFEESLIKHFQKSDKAKVIEDFPMSVTTPGFEEGRCICPQCIKFGTCKDRK